MLMLLMKIVVSIHEMRRTPYSVKKELSIDDYIVNVLKWVLYNVAHIRTSIMCLPFCYGNFVSGHFLARLYIYRTYIFISAFFVASLGGNFGLFVGMSYLTVCEFLDYGVRKIYHKMFSSKKNTK